MSDEKKQENPVVSFLEGVAAQHQEACPVNQVCKALIAGIDDGSVSTSSGPAQVATEAYRNNYATIFGKKQVVGQA